MLKFEYFWPCEWLLPIMAQMSCFQRMRPHDKVSASYSSGEKLTSFKRKIHSCLANIIIRLQIIKYGFLSCLQPFLHKYGSLMALTLKTSKRGTARQSETKSDVFISEVHPWPPTYSLAWTVWWLQSWPIATWPWPTYSDTESMNRTDSFNFDLCPTALS